MDGTNVFPHHPNTRFVSSGLWQITDRRLQGLDFLTPSSLVVYAGGNTDAYDGRIILQQHNCSISIFEPVPNFWEPLKKIWYEHHKQFGFRSEIYNFGLGKDDRWLYLPIQFMRQCQVEVQVLKTKVLVLFWK